MAVAKEDRVASEHLVPPAFKEFLESFSLGRWSIRGGRKIVAALRKMRDPAMRKVWTGRFCLPLRNAMLLNRPIKVSFDGIPVLLEPRGAVAAAIWSGLRRDSQNVSFILSVLEPGMIFFDAGANVGLFAINAARKLGAKQVFASESRSATCELLKKNLALNGLGDVNVEETALGESAQAGREDVRRTTVEAFLKARNVPRVDVMHVDAAGEELMVFRGARELLERADAPLILYDGSGFLTRAFGYHPVEILWLLESCGYSLFVMNSETGAISDLKPDYQYDSMVIAVKPGNAAFADWSARVK